MRTLHSFCDFEEALLTCDSLEQLQDEIDSYLLQYPEQVYGTTIIREPYETIDGKHRAEIRRWAEA